MSNKVAPDGQVFVCHACGKRSKDEYGYQEINYGWDESCTLNCAIYDESRLVIGSSGRVVEIKPPPEPDPPATEA